jgi:hypothetical protein
MQGIAAAGPVHEAAADHPSEHRTDQNGGNGKLFGAAAQVKV